MKRTHIIFMIGAITLLMVSCGKDVEESRSLKSYDTFYITPPTLTSDSKAYVEFTELSSRILYEVSDKIYINGVQFTLEKSGDMWVARRSDGNNENLVSDQFDICYADGVVSGYSASNHTYNVSIIDNYATTNGIVMAGNTQSNELTLTPCFAVLVFQPTDIDAYDGVRIGFNGITVPHTFTVTSTSTSTSITSVSNNGYFDGITQTQQEASQFLSMKKKGNYFYIAIPIEGESVSTKLFMEYTLHSGSVEKHVTKGEVSLARGKVYMLPDETRNGYAFDSDGAGVGIFTVGPNKWINFSAGNLQFKANPREWKFAEYQWIVIGSDNTNIKNTYTGFIDLFGYGTSGTQVGSDNYQWQPYAISGTFYQANLINTNADWGVANTGSIKYGNGTSSRSWRTLSYNEWDTLLNYRSNATNLRGRATVAGVNGLVLLPDNWPNNWNQSNPSFTPNATYGTNVYSTIQWDTFEKAGAIFLPAEGYRSSKTVSQSGHGYYWSSSYDSNNKAYRVLFPGNTNNTNITLGSTNNNTQHGMCVRLVSNIINN